MGGFCITEECDEMCTCSTEMSCLSGRDTDFNNIGCNWYPQDNDADLCIPICSCDGSATDCSIQRRCECNLDQNPFECALESENCIWDSDNNECIVGKLNLNVSVCLHLLFVHIIYRSMYIKLCWLW